MRLVAGKAALAALALAMCGRAKAANVREFGAVGDGVADDTAAVQSTIDAGGEVRFPPGVYLVSSIYLRSGGGLELDADAVLKMQPDRAKWHIFGECAKYDSFGANASHAHLVNCIGATNVFIRGGTIDGDYRSFYKREYFYQCGGRRFMKPRIRKGDPSQMVWFFESAGVVLENVRLVNAPFWALMLHGCEDVALNGVVVEGADEILNSDGIDIDCCSRVRVAKCRVRTGDDALAVRANTYALTRPRPCEHVTICGASPEGELHFWRDFATFCEESVGPVPKANFISGAILLHSAKISAANCSAGPKPRDLWARGVTALVRF